MALAHIILIGPMGAGKTTIGKSLSQALNLPFVDVDHAVVERAGADIPWIFDMEGEQGFRKRESQALLEALSADVSVIATGGGIVTVEENVRELRKLPGVIFLDTSVENQFKRTEKDKNRPLLQQENPKKVLEDLYALRQPLYKESANFTVSTDENKPKMVVEKIIEFWRAL